MRRKLIRIFKISILLLIALLVGFLTARIFATQNGSPLQIWHKYVPNDLTAEQLDKMNWQQYINAENGIFEQVRAQVTEKLNPSEQNLGNRYFKGSPIYPGNFSQDWNRSYLLMPTGKTVGAVVLLHGLTDSPYSLRHIAQSYQAHGFVVVAIRLPGHGTVPAGLSKVEWEDWMAATRLAVREAQRHLDANMPLHLVGFSNGGALAMKYSLDALQNPQLRQADRLVLISPMIGVTRFARFAGLAGLPAMLPAFAKAAWLGIVPEFNPFKYNSFPVNGARQSHRLTEALQEQIAYLARSGDLLKVPPILTFQSVMDYTVSTSAIISRLYAYLPKNNSELVLFDVNRSVKFNPLLRANANRALSRLLPRPPQNYRITVIANSSDNNNAVVERSIIPGTTLEVIRPLALSYPANIFSLSHIALPFPMDDPLYGVEPDPKTKDEFGVSLGTLTARGERGALILNMDTLSRISSNPFFPYMLQRISEYSKAEKIVSQLRSGGSVKYLVPNVYGITSDQDNEEELDAVSPP
ncbi:alpha/beta hydrolase [Neisseriaceae bacterium TC5R-5]|nr:alpha/beta hydrolase [Neisseriaceae bacterium TC5R-5]